VGSHLPHSQNIGTLGSKVLQDFQRIVLGCHMERGVAIVVFGVDKELLAMLRQEQDVKDVQNNPIGFAIS